MCEHYWFQRNFICWHGHESNKKCFISRTSSCPPFFAFSSSRAPLAPWLFLSKNISHCCCQKWLWLIPQVLWRNQCWCSLKFNRKKKPSSIPWKGAALWADTARYWALWSWSCNAHKCLLKCKRSWFAGGKPECSVFTKQIHALCRRSLIYFLGRSRSFLLSIPEQ